MAWESNHVIHNEHWKVSFGIFVRTHVLSYLHRAHEPRSTCDVELIKSKLLFKASCMRQGRPQGEDPSSGLIRLTLFARWLLRTWLISIASRFQFLRLRWHLCRCPGLSSYINTQATLLMILFGQGYYEGFRWDPQPSKRITKYNFVGVMYDLEAESQEGAKLRKGQSGSAQISIETGSMVTTVILSAARAALIVLVPVGCSHS